MRNSGNLVIFHGRDGLIDGLVAGALHRVRLPQPDVEEKSAFLRWSLSLYNSARLEEELTAESAARLTRLARESHGNDGARTLIEDVVAQYKHRAQDRLLPTSRFNDLQGFTIEVGGLSLAARRSSGRVESADLEAGECLADTAPEMLPICYEII